MAYADAWTATEDVEPVDSLPIYQIPDSERTTRHMVRERMEAEHKLELDGGVEQGIHKQGSARVWLSETEPTSATPVAGTADTTDTKIGRIWVVIDSAGDPTGVIKVHDGTNWVPVPSVGPLPADVVSYGTGKDVATILTNVGMTGYFTTLATNTPSATYNWSITLLAGYGASTARLYIAHCQDNGWLYRGYGTGSTITWNPLWGRGLPYSSASTGSSSPDDQLYATIDSYIPNVGNRMVVSGGIKYSVGISLIVAYAQRISATQISFVGLLSDASTAGAIEVTNGSSTIRTWSLAW